MPHISMRTFCWFQSMRENKKVSKIKTKERRGILVIQQENKRKPKTDSVLTRREQTEKPQVCGHQMFSADRTLPF